MSADQIVLPGLDGSNPLGFFAALGLLRILHDHRAIDDMAPALSWVDQGRWMAALTGHGGKEAVLACVEEDLAQSLDDPALALAYDATGAPTQDGNIATRDLKPLPATLRAFQDGIAAGVSHGAAHDSRRLRTADHVVAYGSEMATDNKGFVKPSALHFTAGQQSFLSMVRELAQGVERSHLEEALWGPWTSASKLPSLSWNAAAPRIYALRATNPGKEKRGSVPGAEWLAFVGLAYFYSVSAGRRLRTACVRGGWKDAVLTWPLWSVPVTMPVIRSLLSRSDTADLTAAARASAGIELVLQSRILRSDQGGYGSFSPSVIL